MTTPIIADIDGLYDQYDHLLAILGDPHTLPAEWVRENYGSWAAPESAHKVLRKELARKIVDDEKFVGSLGAGLFGHAEDLCVSAHNAIAAIDPQRLGEDRRRRLALAVHLLWAVTHDDTEPIR